MLQTQQDLERQMNEVLSKISTLQEASQKRSDAAELVVNVPPSAVAHQTDPDADKYQKKLEDLEAQLITQIKRKMN